MEPAGRLLAIATKPKTRVPMLLHDALALGPRGLPGERAHPAERAVTVLARESWETACRALGAELSWTLRRANLLVEGVALADTLGGRLEIGGVVLEISEETEPCRVMDAQHAGLRAALAPEWRGGVSCRVLRAGELRVGAPVRLLR